MITEILKNIIIGSPGSYNMLSLEIEIEGKSNSERNSTVFHEYTHYLQNMTTINGFISLDKYIHVLLACFTKLGSDIVDPKTPLKSYSELQTLLGDKNIENIIRARMFGMDYDYLNKKYIFQNTNLNDYTLSEQEYLDPYSGLLFIIPYIAVDGKNIPINETVIKENMALVNSIIASPTYKKLSNADINEILSYEYKEYNVLFDFINHYLPNCDLLKLVYCICEISLNIQFSEKIIGNILRLIQEESIEIAKMQTDKIIYLIREAINYDKIFFKLYSIIREQAIKATNALFNQFDFSKNQFIGIIRKFYNFLSNGLEYRAKQKTFYVNRFTNNYIQELAAVIGSPVMYFHAENEYRGLSETPDYFFEDFTYLHGALKIFTQLYDSDVTECPFLRGNICRVSKNENCNNNCLSNYNDNVYNNCLLSNALTCTGIRQERRHGVKN